MAAACRCRSCSRPATSTTPPCSKRYWTPSVSRAPGGEGHAPARTGSWRTRRIRPGRSAPGAGVMASPLRSLNALTRSPTGSAGPPEAAGLPSSTRTRTSTATSSRGAQPAQAVPRGGDPLRQARGPLPGRTPPRLADPLAPRARVGTRSARGWQHGEHTRWDPQLTQSGQERCFLFLRDLNPQGRSRVAGAEDQPAVPPAFGVDCVGSQVRQHPEVPVVSDIKVDPHPRIGAPGPGTAHDLLPSQR